MLLQVLLVGGGYPHTADYRLATRTELGEALESFSNLAEVFYIG